jgi:hypothetical protein
MKEARRFNQKLTTNYYDFLPVFIKQYNDTVHTSTKETPDSIYNGNALSQEKLKLRISESPTFKIDDYVRLSKVKRTFEKGYTEKWTQEAFKIVNIDSKTEPIMYEVVDIMGEEIIGKFYAPELQITKVPFVKIIDKVVSRKKVNRKKMVEINYLGHPVKYNEWIPDSKWKQWVTFKKNLDDL